MTLLVVMSSCRSDETGSVYHDLSISSSSIEISWEVLTNVDSGSEFTAELTFHNGGDSVFPGSGWVLYFNSIRMLNHDSFLPYFNSVHINGDFFSLTPTDSFGDLEPGESRTVEYNAAFFSIKASDAPSGFYFVMGDGTIEAVEETIVIPFTREEQTMRSGSDRLPVADTGFLFGENQKLTLLDRSALSPITPTPVHMEFLPGEFLLPSTVIIEHDALLNREAEYLSELLLSLYQVSSRTVLAGAGTEQADIVLENVREPFGEEEAYTLVAEGGQVRIASGSASGVFYGIQSLRSLLSNREGDELRISNIRIEDEPAFEYRGMHLDVSRNFQPAESVKQLLDLMAMYKLNRFHFHLTDDEGWRLAIDSLPELVQVGARRGHTLTEGEYLIPSYGSGPDPTPGASFGSGWYSRHEYIDLLRYATDRHIEVIPEIDVPGHARAAIVAMRARTERLRAAGEEAAAERFRLDEEGDLSEYLSIQNFNDNTINVCIESTYDFLELVFDELIEMHEEAGAPLHTIHVGGDEVAMGVWEKSPACASLMEQEGISNVRDLQVYFFDRLNRMLLDRDLQMAGWEEVVFFQDPDDGSHTPNPQFTENVIPHVWSNIWGYGTEEYAYQLANMGYRVIMSHASNFYFDLAYSNHWEEPGFYWAAMFDTRAPFSFIPFDLYRNAITDSYGNPIEEERYAEATPLLPSARENIIGLQGQLWTETVNRESRMEYMILPRLLGLAERAWSGNPDWSEIRNNRQMLEARDVAWNEFANRIGQMEMSRLDESFPGIQYRIPPPGVKMEGGEFHANSAYPGLEIRFTRDG
ncbi:MAG: beta-N-acetylhexosaminidase, partial [Balneolaceae bacterium]